MLSGRPPGGAGCGSICGSVILLLLSRCALLLFAWLGFLGWRGNGYPPRQAAADGGYASGANVTAAKERGVKDVAFHKKRGLTNEQMVKSQWVYRKLRNFRAGIEAGISCLKRAYGLSRCTWKGLAHFQAYVWSSVVAHNLALLTRLKSA